MSTILIIALVLLAYFGYKTMKSPKKEKYCAACLMR